MTAAQGRELRASKDWLYRVALDSIDGLAFWVSEDGRVVHANARALEVLGFTAEELVGMQVHGLDPTLAREAWPAFWKKIQGWKTQRFETSLKTKAGTLLPIQLTTSYIESEGQPMLFAFATTMDVSHEAHERLRYAYESQRILDEILHISLQPLAMEEMLARALDAILSSPTFALLRKGAIFLAKDGCVLELVAQRGLHPALLSSCAAVPFGYCLCGRAAKARSIVFSDHLDHRHEITYDGILPHGHYCVPILSNGELLGVFNTYVPAGQSRSAHDEHMLRMIANALALAIRVRLNFDQLEHMAHTDALTGLPNRTLFFDRLQQALAHAKRNGHGFSVLFIDLDRFKQVNDTLGHEGGDELLKQVASRLLECVRESDTVARMGGDEFTMILVGTDARDGAAKVAQKVIDALRRPFEIQGRECLVGGSVGIAIFPADGEDAETILRHADMAMYEAKKRRDAYAFCSEVCSQDDA